MDRLFGTDGIRGRALVPPLDEVTVRRLGSALARELKAAADRPRLLLAGDTRASTTTLAQWLASGFQADGGRVRWGGVLPTPAVSRLLRSEGYAAGVVISASHNPACDNGIKLLSPTGEKLPDTVELRLEQCLPQTEPGHGPGLPEADTTLADAYLELLAATHDARSPMAGLHVVVDAANGAASSLAAPLLDRLGARVTMIEAEPDGSNINLHCGATDPRRLVAAVQQLGADAGLALDGDADRAVLVDERGSVLDGDDILLIWARHLAASDRLPGGRVVATVMSNFGLERALGRHEMHLIRCPVGDRAVWLAMKEHEASLGGEQSGHIICSHHAVSGDGLLTGTHLLAIASASGRRVSELSGLERLPQVLLNVPVRRRVPFDELPVISTRVDAARQRLDRRGRVLLRYSGTELLARVMVEGDDAQEITVLAEEIAETVRRELR